MFKIEYSLIEQLTCLQNTKERDIQGELLGYIVQYHILDSADEMRNETKEINVRWNYFEVPLLCNETFSFKIFTRNGKGNSLDQSDIIIPTANEGKYLYITCTSINR